MSTAMLQAHLEGLVEEAITTDKEAQEALRYEMGKLRTLRLQQSGIAASDLEPGQKDALAAQHSHCAHAEAKGGRLGPCPRTNL